MPKKKTEKYELSLQELLTATSHEKLVGIMLSLYSNNPDLQKQLDIIFAGLNEDPKKIATLIKKEIASLKKSTKFVGYYESDALADRLNDLRLRIVNDLNAKSSKLAFDMMLDFLDLHPKTFERGDDSNGGVGYVFRKACEDLGNLGQNIDDLSVKEIVQLVFERFINNDYGIYDDIITNFKGVLKDQGIDLVQEKLEQETKNIPKKDKYYSYRITRGLQCIADCKNDVDQYIRACSFEREVIAHDHLEIAKRLIKHWRAIEALKWLDTMDISANHFWQNERNELKIQALELDGQYEQAQNERLEWFFKTLSPKLYGEILKASSQDTKETFRSDAIQKVYEFPEAHTALHFLIEIQEFNEVAKFVRLRRDELNGDHYSLLRPAADLLQNTDPIAATLLYRKMLEAILDKTKSKYYNYAAKDLIMCANLNTKITDWQEEQTHEEFYNHIALKHKRKPSFWAEYQSALQKQAAKEAKLAARASKTV